MREFLTMLKDEEKNLMDVIKLVTPSTSKEKLGKLYVSRRGSGSSVQIYMIPANSTNNTRVYLGKQNQALARKLAQRDYEDKLLKMASARLSQTRKLISLCEKGELEEVYDRLSPGRKSLVEARILSTADFVNEWLSLDYEKKRFSDGIAEFYTENGERVRSKSEKIIADMLYHAGIPYRYEFPLLLNGLGVIHPDFTILDQRSRKNILWEHFGMMDNNEYCIHAINRINLYMKQGIMQGSGLITTFETSKQPLETTVIKKIINSLK